MKKGPLIIVFGITGDLARRKLLPALYHLLRQELLPRGTKIIGLSRRPLSAEELLKQVELCVLEKDGNCESTGLAKVQAAIETLQLDPNEAANYSELVRLVDRLDPDEGRERLFYMSVPAAAYTAIVSNLAAARLNGPMNRLLVEKPFGHDYNSAQELLEITGANFQEGQVYRIDHYLAKETAQNLLAFRMHNPIFAPLWSSEYITSVHVRALEKIGIEGRTGFYEQTGALRDLIQSHLMQLLALTLMDVPADMSSEAIHTSKQAFFSQLQPADPQTARRGQYEGYPREVDNPESTIETYARINLEHSSGRWQGTEIILETGKGLAEKTTDITMEFKQPHDPRRNKLIFRLQPNEGISLGLMVKEPGFENRMHRAQLNFSYDSLFAGQNIDAYERVLMDAIRGDQALFASADEVLVTWQVLQPLLSAWENEDKGLITYPLGSETPLKGHAA